MDFIVQLPQTKSGYDAIMVVVDRCSKEAFYTPMYTNATAPDVAMLYFENICRRRGLPSIYSILIVIVSSHLCFGTRYGNYLVLV